MKRITILVSVLLVLRVIPLGACGGSQKRGEELMTSVMTYNDGVRWGRFANAASRVPVAERETFLDEKDDLAEDLRISDWEIVKIRPIGESRAKVQVEYTWFLDSEGTVHETHAEQRWERRGETWMIVDERFKKGDPMPGLPDPQPEDEVEGEAEGDGAGETGPTASR